MSQPAPQHVNQFSAGGRFPNGSSSARYDCTVAVGVMMADAATGGRVRPSTTQLRAAQSDQSGGIGFNDVATALGKLAGLKVRHGPTTWPTLTKRWDAGDGAGIQGYYAVVPKPESSQLGGKFGHAIYVQRRTRPGYLMVNDPLAGAAREWRESIVQRFYITGLATAAWVTNGSASSLGDFGSAEQKQAMLDAWGGIVSFPVGHIITVADVELMMTRLSDAGWFRDYALEFAPGEGAARDLTRGILMTAVGKPWNKALQDDLQARFFAGALLANPVGDAIGQAAGTIIAGLGDLGRNLLLLGFALTVLLLGLAVLVWAQDDGTKLPGRV